MTDLAVLVPSRGRPGNVARLVEACAKTCRADTVLHFGFDDDDDYEANVKAADLCMWEVETRKGLVPWTNALAARHPDVPYLASIGDDMVPLTDGWDEQLITGAEHAGGMAFPDDRRRNDIPEAIVMDSRIVRALGWMGLPDLDHWFVDCVWRDLGTGARCLGYCPQVVVEHRHPHVTGQPADRTYTEASLSYARDLAAYQKWRIRRMKQDVMTVRTCLNLHP